MLDRKYFTSTHVVLVLTLIRVELLKELVVHTRRLSMHRFARVIQNNKDTRGTLALDQIAHRLVVKVWNLGPRNSLSFVLFLFCFECQLDKDLLKFLIHKVDTELLETVSLKDLKTVNIKNTNGERIIVLTSCSFLQSTIHVSHDRVKQLRVPVMFECCVIVS